MAMKVFTSLRKLFPSLAVLVVGLSIAGSTAKAEPIGFDPDGAAPTNGTLNVGSFGFETANTLAQASISGNQVLPVGGTFQLFLQTRLTNLTISPGGSTVTPAGLNGTAGGPAFEVTLVASITEVVTARNSATGQASFATAGVQSPLSFIRMFYHPGQLSDNFTGAGFAVGTQILSAFPNAVLGSSGDFQVSTANGLPVPNSAFDTFDAPSSAPGLAYAGVTSVSGSGGALVNGNIQTADPNFFKSPVVTVRFDAFNNVPFTATTPSQFFNSFANTPTIPANRGPANGFSGPDFQFQSRTSANFSLVPEPSTLAMAPIAMGFVSLAGLWTRRRRGAR